MIRQVAVVHKAFEDIPRTVALVQVPEGVTDDMQALDYAYEKTNNINGSWSMGAKFEDGTVNMDYSPAVKVMTELPVSKRTGQTMGLRSTSVGDQMFIGDKKYEVGFVGFEEMI